MTMTVLQDQPKETRVLVKIMHKEMLRNSTICIYQHMHVFQLKYWLFRSRTMDYINENASNQRLHIRLSPYAQL